MRRARPCCPPLRGGLISRVSGACMEEPGPGVPRSACEVMYEQRADKKEEGLYEGQSCRCLALWQLRFASVQETTVSWRTSNLAKSHFQPPQHPKLTLLFEHALSIARLPQFTSESLGRKQQ